MRCGEWIEAVRKGGYSFMIFWDCETVMVWASWWMGDFDL
jgi:hypothetical protein